MNNLTPDTTLALLQAAQGDAKRAAGEIKKAKQLEQAEAAARDFEAMFLSEMMKPMFAGIETEPPFGGGKGEEVFRGFMIQEYGKLASQTGGIGLADQVKDYIIKMQEEMDKGSTQQGLTQMRETENNE